MSRRHSGSRQRAANLMRKTFVGVCSPLFLAFPVGCGVVEFPTCTDPTFEELETCAKIARDWRSRIGRVDTEGWYHVKECSIDDDDGKPTQVRIDVWSSLKPDGDDCTEFSSALKSAVESRMETQVAVNASVVTSDATCASTTFFLHHAEAVPDP